jgi:hypothetical protein
MLVESAAACLSTPFLAEALGANLPHGGENRCAAPILPLLARPFGTAWPQGMPGRFINTTRGRGLRTPT